MLLASQDMMGSFWFCFHLKQESYSIPQANLEFAMCSPGWSQTCDSPALASQVLVLQVKATIPGTLLNF
jgi:hypothetical protein